MKYIKAVLPLLFMLMLGGCCGTEPNDVAYVVALGFDKTENENSYLMTIQFARPNNISGGGNEEGGSGQEIVENIAVEAPNVYAGISTANHIISKRLTLAHSKLIVFSEDVAKDGISDIMESLSRNEEVRPDIYLAVAIGKARDYLYEIKPVVEINPARYYQLIYEQHCSSGLPEKNSVDFYFDERSGMRDSVLPLAGVIDTEEESQSSSGGENNSDEGEDPEKTQNKNQKNAPENTSGFEFRLKNYVAGEVAVNQKDKSEAMGMAIFKNEKEVLRVGSTDTDIYKIMNGTFKKSYLTLENSDGEPVTVKMEQTKSPSYKIDKKKRRVDITVYFESDVYSLPSGYTLENDIAGFEESAKRQIKEAAEKFVRDVIKAHNVDLLGLRGKFKKCFLTNAKFNEEKDEIMDYDIHVDVAFHISRTGLTIKEEEK